ncbi:hypothetical protein ILYODFUR_039004 [Ilyodon furcidens]|uniref:Uncharacterized protein n=1 Tax=Ilyodon furcidens TaxID=33524 RepID=A0ABV0URC8_9TELE
MLKRRVNHDSPTTSRDLRYSGRISSTPEALPPRSFLTTSVPSVLVMKESNPESPACFHQGMHDGIIEVILEVLLPPPDNVPSRGQQLPTPTVNSVGEALLPPPEALEGLPELLRGQLVVLFHGLTELLPGPSFCLCHSPGHGTLGLTVPVSCLRSPTSQPQPIGLLLQLDSVLYCQCPPPGSGIAATTGTADLTAAATGSSIDNICGEHGPLRLYVSNLPWNLVKTLPEVGVEYIPDQGLCQMFPAEPHYTFGPAKSVSSLPADPTHCQVVISRQLSPSLHLSVQNMRPKV